MKVSAYASHSAKGELKPLDYEAADPGPLEVDVRVTHCGVCHSDLSMIDNEWGWAEYPLVPGHEVIGEVVVVGKQVTEPKVGERVGVGWQSGSCLTCRYCRQGKEHLCNNREWTIVGRHGGFASHVRCQARWAVRIPKALDSSVAGPLMCAGTTVWSSLMHHGVRPGIQTAVVGIGGVGHLGVQFLAKFGTNVTAISTTRSKEKDARELGASDFIATRGTDELEKAAGRFDFILSTVSADLEWERFLNALAPEGKLCICGIPTSEVKFPPFPLIIGERTVCGGLAGAPGDTANMMAFCAAQGVKPMIEEFAMKDVNRAVQHVRDGKARYRAVLAA